MQREIQLSGKPKIVTLFLIATVFFLLLLNSARVHFNHSANTGLNRTDLIAQIGPWLHGKIQKHEAPDHWVARRVSELKAGPSAAYRCSLGPIEVRGWGERVVASILVEDASGTQTRFFTLDWNSGKQKWVCEFYSSGDNSGIHPEENGFAWVGRLLLRAHLEGSSQWQDGGTPGE